MLRSAACIPPRRTSSSPPVTAAAFFVLVSLAGRRKNPGKTRNLKVRGLDPGGGVISAQLFYTGRNIHGPVAVHLQDGVCDIEKCTGAAGYKDRGDSCFFVQVPGPLQKGSDGFLFPADDLLHKFIPDHKVGGGSVFVNEEQPGPRLYAFHDPCRLGGAAAGILRGEAARIFFVGKIPDKQGDIHLADGTSVLGSKLHGRVVRDHIFPSVPGDMIIHPHLQSLQESRFSVVSSSHDQGDPLFYSHPLYGTAVGQLQSRLHGSGRDKGHAAFHGKVGDSAFPGEHGAVGHKRHQLLFL